MSALQYIPILSEIILTYVLLIVTPNKNRCIDIFLLIDVIRPLQNLYRLNMHYVAYANNMRTLCLHFTFASNKGYEYTYKLKKEETARNIAHRNA